MVGERNRRGKHDHSTTFEACSQNMDSIGATGSDISAPAGLLLVVSRTSQKENIGILELVSLTNAKNLQISLERLFFLIIANQSDHDRKDRLS
jgi:hypothetical protein